MAQHGMAWHGMRQACGVPYFQSGGYTSGRAADEEAGADERFLPAASTVGRRAEVFLWRLYRFPVRAGGVGQCAGFEIVKVGQVAAFEVVNGEEFSASDVVGVGEVTAFEVDLVRVVTAFEVVGGGGKRNSSDGFDGGAVDQRACSEEGEEEVDNRMHG